MQEKKLSSANYFAVPKTDEYWNWWLQRRFIQKYIYLKIIEERRLFVQIEMRDNF